MTITSTNSGSTASHDAEIVRRAERGDDELLLTVDADRSWWVTRQVAGVAKACAYIGEDAAERDFDLFLSSPSPRGEWVETEVDARAA